jgi:hypothetical protein
VESASLLLAIVGGFIFSDRFKVTQLRIARATGYELAFLSMVSAYLFFQVACLGLYPFYAPGWTFDGFLALWLHPVENRLPVAVVRDVIGSLVLFKSNLIPPSVTAFWIGVLAWYPANKIVGRFWLPIQLYARMVTQYGSELERLLLSAVATGRQVQATLDNGKVYVGSVIQLPKLRRTERDQLLGFTLLVTKSGYRDAKTHKFCLTTNYDWIYDSKAPLAKVGELETFIPLQRIVSATYFDPALYEQFQKQPPPGPQEPPPTHVPFRRRHSRI